MTTPLEASRLQANPQHVAETFELKYPVVYASNSYTTLAFRRPKVKDLKIFDMAQGNDGIRTQAQFLSTICVGNPPYQLFEELDLEDSNAINSWVKGFIKGTGTN